MPNFTLTSLTGFLELKKYDDTLPVSDDESNYLDNFNNNYENEAKQNKNSPKIFSDFKPPESIKGTEIHQKGDIIKNYFNYLS